MPLTASANAAPTAAKRLGKAGYDPDEPRGSDGKWTDGDGGSEDSAKPVQVADSGQIASDARQEQVGQGDDENVPLLGAAARRVIVQRAIDEKLISPEEGAQYLANAEAVDAGTAKSFNTLTRELVQIPSNWTADEADGEGGVFYRNPNNPKQDYVRIMPGNPQSSNPAQQGPYVIDNLNGGFLTKDGNRIQGGNREETHIPLQNYRFDKR